MNKDRTLAEEVQRDGFKVKEGRTNGRPVLHVIDPERSLHGSRTIAERWEWTAAKAALLAARAGSERERWAA